MTEKLSDKRLHEIVKSNKNMTIVELASGIIELRSERDRLRVALQRIATGDGYYGSMAREYKEIARIALNEQ